MSAVSPSNLKADFIVIGAGIAGASVAYWLAPHGRVMVLEREAQPGYHTTGRSAALFLESYGGPQVRALTLASRAFLADPPVGFSDTPLLSTRGALMVAAPGEEALLDAHWEVLRDIGSSVGNIDGGGGNKARRLSRDEACAMVPVLRPERVVAATFEPDAADMDVDAIHQGFLRGLRRAGGEVICNAGVTGLAWRGDRWRVEVGADFGGAVGASAGDSNGDSNGEGGGGSVGGRVFEAPIVLNAAGAWADEVALLAGVAPIGLEPRRRSAMVFDLPRGVDASRWPTVNGAGGDWYMKPEAGAMLGSPANADPTPPQDVQPEEIDIATAITRIEENTTLTIRRPTRTWAGLRSFVADGDLVAGFDADAPGFFWLAAQGGYGIQTSAAMGETCAALARGLPVPAHAAAFGVTAEMLSPGRLRG